MRVRKVAKQLKLFHKNSYWSDFDACEPIIGYRIANHDAKVAYIMRMTRKHYFGLAKKYKPDTMMGRLYIHKACSPYLYEDIMSFWGCDLCE